MNVDGSYEWRLTNVIGNDYHPSWSPDGKRIVFVSWRDKDRELYIMNVETGETKRLTYSAQGKFDPSWSPDGKRIVFSAHIQLEDQTSQIYIINVDGSGEKCLTSNRGEKYSPVWSADGSQIYYVSDNQGSPSLLSINPSNKKTKLIKDFGGFSVWDLDLSSDGQWFTYDLNKSVYKMRINGNEDTSVVDDAYRNGEPVWCR